MTVLRMVVRSCPFSIGIALAMVGCYGHASQGEGSPGPGRLVAGRAREPLDLRRAAEYYTECQQQQERLAGASDRLNDGTGLINLALQLVPFTSAVADQNEGWFDSGKFVGVIKNFGPGSWRPLNIKPELGGAPSVTCVWLGRAPGESGLHAHLITPDTFVTVPISRVTFHPGHSKARASWLEKSAYLIRQLDSIENDSAFSPVVVRQLSYASEEDLRMLLRSFWFTCDQAGCCKQQ